MIIKYQFKKLQAILEEGEGGGGGNSMHPYTRFLALPLCSSKFNQNINDEMHTSTRLAGEELISSTS